MDLDEASPRSRVAVLLKEFSRLDDDREPWRTRFSLAEVLLLLTCATIAECDDIVAWGTRHLPVPRRFSEFHHGIPCARRLRILVNRIDSVLFGRCFESWVAALWPNGYPAIWATKAEEYMRTTIDTARLRGANPFDFLIATLALTCRRREICTSKRLRMGSYGFHNSILIQPFP